MRMIRKGFAALAVALVLALLYAGGSAENAFEIRRVGKINPYADNIFRITAAEAGDVTVRIHDNICVYRELREHVEAGVTDIHWDGCSYNEERLYSLDLLRGLDMVFLTVVGPLVWAVHAGWGLPDGFLYQFTHPWEGFAAWDIIMPLFI